jgi:hypothetical protein
MTQHTNDAFGDETSRPDALPNALPDATSDISSAEQKPDEAAETEAASARSEAPAAETPPLRTSPRKPSRAHQAKDAETGAEPAERPATPASDPLQDLEAQGFSPAEARRLIYISDRVGQSAEARESEATLRRLRFTRWLVEHGMLDEWSA